ncbi:MAG: hypothetical protein AAFQ80_16470 [Cyanobacteria bacterium J06621_8]
MSIAPDQYLSAEESADVDAALLSSSEKFLARLTISSQRLLKTIAKDSETSIENLTHEQIIRWFENDSQVKREQGENSGTLRW